MTAKKKWGPGDNFSGWPYYIPLREGGQAAPAEGRLLRPRARGRGHSPPDGSSDKSTGKFSTQIYCFTT